MNQIYLFSWEGTMETIYGIQNESGIASFSKHFPHTKKLCSVERGMSPEDVQNRLIKEEGEYYNCPEFLEKIKWCVNRFSRNNSLT